MIDPERFNKMMTEYPELKPLFDNMLDTIKDMSEISLDSVNLIRDIIKLPELNKTPEGRAWMIKSNDVGIRIDSDIKKIMYSTAKIKEFFGDVLKQP